MAKNKAKMNKFLTGAITATMVATAVAPVAALADEQKIDFSDVSKDSSHYPNIIKAAERGLMTGYQGKFNPLAEMSRGQVVKALGKYLVAQEGLTLDEYLADKGLLTKVTPFNDVPANARDQELFKYSLVVKDAEAFTGNKNNLLAQNNITREQMSKVLVNAFNLKSVAGKDANVADMNLVQAQYQSYVTVLSQHEITRADDNNYRPKGNVTRQQMASFLNRAYDVVHGADKENPAISSVKAINNTTVEVTFKEAISDIKALDFAIEGLTVSNAVVKQSNAKTAVLTTSAQEGDKKYTVTESGEAIGTFKGISAVIPSKIDVTSNSTQAVVGKEVTLSAKVEVAAGQSKAGIPVTFNVITDRPGVNNGQIKEVYTNADGVATFSYTQYYGGEDTVVAYPTGAPATRSTEGKVYWGVAEQLTLTEVTSGNTLANGSKKVYKVVAKNRDGSGAALKGTSVNIAFLENVNVAQDKGVTGVKVTDATTNNGQYPYQYTTGGANNHKQVQVKLDENGEATFTLTGENASVTPVVFFDGTLIATGIDPNTSNKKWDATELQVQAPTVKFDAVQNIEVVVESIGTKNAAAISGNNEGGRDYQATIRNKDGKLAPEGTEVFVNVDADDLNGQVYLGKKSDNKQFTKGNKKGFSLKVGKDGIVKFTLIGDKNAYATPTVYINNGDKPNVLDPKDAQGKGEIVYFGDAVLKTATLKVVNPATNKEVKSIETPGPVEFHFQVTDQNGKNNNSATFKSTFEVTNAGFVNAITANGVEILADKTKSVPFTVNNGKAILSVLADGPTTVNVDVSSSQVTLDGKVATVDFTKANVLPATHTGLAKIDTAKKELTFLKSNVVDPNVLDPASYNAVSYDGATFMNAQKVEISQSEFEDLLTNDPTMYDKITSKRDANGKYTFEIVELDTATIVVPVQPTPPVTGEVKFTNTIFNDSSPQAITLKDMDLANLGSTVVNVTDSGTGSINLTLNEGLAGTFTANLTAAQLATLAEGTITVTYHDAKNAAGNPATATHTATLDVTAPTLLSAKLVQTNATAEVEVAGQNVLVELDGQLAVDGAGAYGNNAKLIIKNGTGLGASASASFNPATGELTVTKGRILGGNVPMTLAQLATLIDGETGFKATITTAGTVNVSNGTTNFTGGEDVITTTFSENMPTGMAFDVNTNFEFNQGGVATVVGTTANPNSGIYKVTLTSSDRQINNADINAKVTSNWTDAAGNAVSTNVVTITQ